MKPLMGVEYGRGATANIVISGGPALAPAAVYEMFPNTEKITVTPDDVDINTCAADRFGENFEIQKKIYAATPTGRHIMIGGDHSTNFGHFAAIADQMPDADMCLVYVDAHLDMHTPKSSQTQASGAPHGTNVHALLGNGDARWLSLQHRRPALRPENVFFIGTRSWEPAEINAVQDMDIFMRRAADVHDHIALSQTIAEIRSRINGRPFVLSFDFDAIDPKFFSDVLVPEPNGISVDAALEIVRAFAPDAHSVEFVEYAPTGDAHSKQIVQQMVEIALNA